MSYLNKQSTYLFSFVPYTKYFLLLVLAEKNCLCCFLFFLVPIKKGLTKFLLPKKLPNFLYPSYKKRNTKKKVACFFPTKLLCSFFFEKNYYAFAFMSKKSGMFITL
jgi:hypothetical protein